MSQNPNEINEVVPCMSSHYDTTLLAEELYLKVPSATPRGPLRSVFVDSDPYFTLMEQCGPPLFALAAAYADSDPLAVAHYITLLRSPDAGFVGEVGGGGGQATGAGVRPRAPGGEVEQPMARVNVEDLLAEKLKRPLTGYSHAYVLERRNTNDVWLVPFDYHHEPTVRLTSERSLTEAWAIKDEVVGLLKAMRRIQRAVDGIQ